MRRLPLYPDEPDILATTTASRALSAGCKLCAAGARAKTRCISADGVTGGVYVLGGEPSREADVSGRPWTSQAEMAIRAIARRAVRTAATPVVWDYAVRCRGGLDVDGAAACSGYLATVLDAVGPERVVLVGKEAVLAVLGRAVALRSVAGGYAWLRLRSGRLVPAYLAEHLEDATDGRHALARVTRELEFCFSRPPPPPPPWDAAYNVVETADDAHMAISALLADFPPWVAYDLEWGGRLHDSNFRVVSAAVCASGSDEAYVWGRAALDDAESRAPLLALLSDQEIGKVGQNIKADIRGARAAWGVDVGPVFGDTQLMRKIVRSDILTGLEHASELVGMGGHKDEAQRELKCARAAVVEYAEKRCSGKATTTSMWSDEQRADPILAGASDAALRQAVENPDAYAYALLPEEIRDRYNARDAVATARLGDLLGCGVAEREPRAWRCVVRDQISAVAWIEHWGIRVDSDALRLLVRHLQLEQSHVKKRLDVYSVDWDSPQQVSRLLFEQLGLRAHDMSEKTGRPSTNKESLKKLVGKHPVISDLIEYRRLSKLLEIYAHLDDHIQGDGRVHGELRIDGAETGRMSMANPPLHGTPTADSREGKLVRDVYVAGPGRKLVNLDYSQQELRVAAGRSGDVVMLDLFASGMDFHVGTARLVAKQCWGIDPEKVDKHHPARKASKQVNFGVLYGMGDRTLARRLGVTESKAKQIRQAIMGKFAALDAWCKQRVAESRATGLVWTYFDGEPCRVRNIEGILSPDGAVRATCEHSAINTDIQGTSAEFSNRAVADVVLWIHRTKADAKLVLTVHDSLLLDVAEAQAFDVARAAHAIMTSYSCFGVPLHVDVEWGDSWGSLEKMPL